MNARDHFIFFLKLRTSCFKIRREKREYRTDTCKRFGNVPRSSNDWVICKVKKAHLLIKRGHFQ
jgi:hypothetical protein